MLQKREEEFSDRLNSRATFHGFTALHYAALTDSLDIVAILLKAGANPSVENDAGHRPFEYAQNEHVRELLVEYAEKVSIYYLYGVLCQKKWSSI